MRDSDSSCIGHNSDRNCLTQAKEMGISLACSLACYPRFFQKESPWDVELHLAAARGDAKRLRILLDSGRVHVDCKDKVSLLPNILIKVLLPQR